MSDRFAYVSAFLSIVVALALTHLLGGIAALLRARIERFSWVYAGWVGIALFGCVDYWFSMWGLRGEDAWSLGYVIFLLVLATVLYLTCQLIVPELRDGEAIDLVEFTRSNGRRFLGALGVYMALGLAANLTISGFAGAVWVNAASVVLISVAWAFRQPRVQGAVTLALIVLFAYYAVTFIPAL